MKTNLAIAAANYAAAAAELGYANNRAAAADKRAAATIIDLQHARAAVTAAHDSLTLAMLNA